MNVLTPALGLVIEGVDISTLYRDAPKAVHGYPFIFGKKVMTHVFTKEYVFVPWFILDDEYPTAVSLLKKPKRAEQIENWLKDRYPKVKTEWAVIPMYRE